VPIYGYDCARCGAVDLVRPMTQAGEPTPVPKMRGPADGSGVPRRCGRSTPRSCVPRTRAPQRRRPRRRRSYPARVPHAHRHRSTSPAPSPPL